MRRTDPLPAALRLAEELDMFPRGQTVLLAVSGGRDSMTLLHWAISHRERWGVRLAVGHYHHGMRGEQADRDMERVQTLCQAHAVPFFAEYGDVYGEGKRRGKGVEEVGRTLRYAFLEALAAQQGAARIATAHNADDNAETLLLHLIRGSGLHGLTGIPPVRGKIVRPLLTTTREEIDSYAARFGLDYGDDVTNFDDAYARNRLRQQVTPVLRTINPRYVHAAATAMELLRLDEDCLRQQTESLLSACTWEGIRLSIPAKALTDAHPAIALRGAKGLLTRFTGEWQFGERHLRGLLALAGSTDPSAQLSLPYGVTARRVYDDLVLERETPAPDCPAIPLRAGVTRWGDWQVTAEGPTEGLVLRARGTGDTLRLGKGHRKTVKKWMIEKKLPRPLRDTLPVAADGDGVLAVAGLGENTDHPRYGVTKIRFQQTEEREGKENGKGH